MIRKMVLLRDAVGSDFPLKIKRCYAYPHHDHMQANAGRTDTLCTPNENLDYDSDILTRTCQSRVSLCKGVLAVCHIHPAIDGPKRNDYLTPGFGKRGFGMSH